MVVVIKILQVILALSVLILIHEAGHFMWAKIFGIRVDKFFLFFDALGVKLFSTRQAWFVRLFPKAASWETEYGIGWLPLGGYCKIAGMVDESMDTRYLRQEPQSWEFRSHPAWQRLIVMAGGVLNNFLLSIILYISILAIWGNAILRNEGHAIYVNELAYDMGFRSGDRILRFDDYEPEDFFMLQADLVRRVAAPRLTAALAPGAGTGDPEAGSTREEDAVPAALVLPGADRRASVTLLRNEDTLQMALSVDSLGRVGVYTRFPDYEIRHYNVLEAVPAGFKLTFSTVGGYLKDLRLVATPRTEAYKSVGSFIAIGQVFPSRWNWYQFLQLLALLSVMLAVMNLLPIPALDGGHIVICLYEIITRRKPSDRFLMVTQMIGMFLLVGLMFLAFGNDIGRLIR